MHVIVTGGTGLIGSSLVQSLIADGNQVTVLTRSPRQKQSPALHGAAVVGWDARTAEGWGHLVNSTDAIVNLAGAGIADSRWSDERKRVILESRIHAGQAVMKALQASDNKPKVLIQSSAVGYYGPHGDERLTEDASPGSDYLARVCFDWESSTAGAKGLGLRRPVVRTGIVLSTKGGALSRMLIPFQFYVGGPLGSGKQYFPWIHIDDEVRAIRHLLQSPDADGPYNLAAPNPPTNKEFSNSLGQAMERPSWMPVPAFGLKLLFGEMSTVLIDGQRAVPQRLESTGFTFTYPATLSALQDIVHNKK